MQMGFPNDSKVKNPPAILEAQETQVRSLGWEDPLRRRQPSPVFLESSSGDFHEQRSLVCYSSWGPKESDETKQLNTHTHTNTQKYADMRSLCNNECYETNMILCHIIWYHLYVESKKKKWYKWTYVKNRNRPTDRENELTAIKEERREG